VTIITAAGVAVVVLLAGSLPWGLLIGANLRAGVSVPWAVVPMAVYLIAYWTFLAGRWGHAVSAARRRRLLHASGLPPRLWGAAIGAGLLGFAALVSLLVLAARVVVLPDGVPIVMPAAMPLATGLILLAMQSTVAGVTEEAAFRGYMQTLVAERHGVVAGVLATGVLFGVLHAPSHPGAVLLMLPYYVAVSAVYGGLTWAADSIQPALALHVGGDIVVLSRWWLTGRPEWQIGPTAPPLVLQSGVDREFVAAAALSVALAAATAVAYRAVYRLRMSAASSA
jgi:membrane protease YdiL (CAAX protease family)